MYNPKNKTVVTFQQYQMMKELCQKVDDNGRCKVVGGGCFYRRPEGIDTPGDRCVVGHILPDDLFEDKGGRIPNDVIQSVTGLFNSFIEVRTHLTPYGLENLDELQELHDGFEEPMVELFEEGFTYESERTFEQAGHFCAGAKAGSQVVATEVFCNSSIYKVGKVVTLHKYDSIDCPLVTDDGFNGLDALWMLKEDWDAMNKEKEEEETADMETLPGYTAMELNLKPGDKVRMVWNTISGEPADEDFWIVHEDNKSVVRPNGDGGRGLAIHRWEVIQRASYPVAPSPKPKQTKKVDNMSNSQRHNYNVTGYGNTLNAIPLAMIPLVAQEAKKFSRKKVAEELELSENAVYRAQLLLRDPHNEPLADVGDYDKDFRVRACVAAVRDGVAITATRMGCSRGSIYNWLKMYKMTTSAFNPKN